jgi:hypothetical protein
MLNESAGRIKQVTNTAPHLLVHLVEGGIEHFSGQKLVAREYPYPDVLQGVYASLIYHGLSLSYEDLARNAE